MSWPGTLADWLAGKRGSADRFQDITDALNTIGEPWVAYTPVWGASTPPTIGNGSITGRKMEAGKFTFFTIAIVIGTTTSAGAGSYTFTTPSTMLNFRSLHGQAEIFDASASTVIPRMVLGVNTTQFALADFTPTRVSNGTPVSYASTDRIDIGGWYEAV